MNAKLLQTAGVVGLLLMGLLPTQAGSRLILRDPNQAVASGGLQIDDNGLGDGSPIPGLISWSGAVGANWIGSVTVGSSKPASGTISSPEMTLQTVAFSSGPASLWIGFSDDSFGPLPPGGALVAEIAGSTPWSLGLITYADPANLLPDLATFDQTQFGRPGQAYQLTYFGNGGVGNDGNVGGFSSSTIASRPGAFSYPYSLTMAMAMDTRGLDGLVEKSSFHATLRRSIPDAGSTLTLLGLSLGTLGIMARCSLTMFSQRPASGVH